MTSFIPMCLKCKYYTGWVDPKADDRQKQMGCKAFPEGIPEDVLMMKFVHTEIYPGQKNKIVFEKK